MTCVTKKIVVVKVIFVCITSGKKKLSIVTIDVIQIWNKFHVSAMLITV